MTAPKHSALPWQVVSGLIQQVDQQGHWGLYVADCSMTDQAAANAAFIVLATSLHAELVSALEPFAKLASEWTGEPDDLEIELRAYDHKPGPGLPLEAFRRAAFLLQKAKQT
jgi:hypothetical protein